MADFLTVNLNYILKNQKSFNDASSMSATTETPSAPARDPAKITDWAKELKDRLTENRALGASERKSDYEVEAQFFEDYFNNANKLWDSDCAEQLINLGEPLKKAIKILGFRRSANPILGFISNSYVIAKLIKTNLLNANTFKAIYNAVSKKLVADSEFMTSNDSNIIYCQDLYRRSASEIEKYLFIQSKILKSSADTYTAEDIEKNKKVFFYIKAINEHGTLDAVATGAALPSAKSSSTKLNSLKLASTLAGERIDDSIRAAGSNTKTSSASTLAKKLGNSNAQAFVALQYLNATTNIPEAAKALKHEAFKSISAEALTSISASVMKVMKEAKLSDKDVKSFISSLLSSLERNS